MHSLKMLRRNSVRRLTPAALAIVATIGCSGPISLPMPSIPMPDRTPRPPIEADSGATAVIARGVVHHALYRRSGPWAIHVLDVDRNACWTPAAIKRDPTAVGRERVSDLLSRVRTAGDTVAAVNADFFLFAPPGVPTGAHIDDRRVITGPGTRPVLTIDSLGRVAMTRLRVAGSVIGRGDTVAITEWNHLPVTRIGVFDERWGVRTDTSSGTLQVAVGRDGKVLQTVRGATGACIPRGGWVIVAGRGAPAAIQRWLGALRAGDIVRVRPRITPSLPVDAVGGFPILVRDSALSPDLEAVGTQNLGRVRHPRTAVGVSGDGRRLFLVVVDGRQPGHSVGMTLHELARLMLEMGATDAMNLDGGGSSAMAVRRSDAEARVVNRPSDAAGERPVGNALAIVKGCMRE
jgi:hypothetical protein